MRLLIKSCYRTECQTSFAHHDDTLQMKFLWRLGFYELTLTIFFYRSLFKICLVQRCKCSIVAWHISLWVWTDDNAVL